MDKNITRALIVKKHWLDKILNEGKLWEMRSTKTNVRGKIGLIESGSGHVIGEIEITGCSLYPIPKTKDLIKFHKVEDLELLNKWKYAWYLSNPKRYFKPKPYKHAKGAVVWVKLKSL